MALLQRSDTVGLVHTWSLTGAADSCSGSGSSRSSNRGAINKSNKASRDRKSPFELVRTIIQRTPFVKKVELESFDFRSFGSTPSSAEFHAALADFVRSVFAHLPLLRNVNMKGGFHHSAPETEEATNSTSAATGQPKRRGGRGRNSTVAQSVEAVSSFDPATAAAAGNNVEAMFIMYLLAELPTETQRLQVLQNAAERVDHDTTHDLALVPKSLTDFKRALGTLFLPHALPLLKHLLTKPSSAGSAAAAAAASVGENSNGNPPNLIKINYNFRNNMERALAVVMRLVRRLTRFEDNSLYYVDQPQYFTPEQQKNYMVGAGLITIAHGIIRAEYHVCSEEVLYEALNLVRDVSDQNDYCVFSVLHLRHSSGKMVLQDILVLIDELSSASLREQTALSSSSCSSASQADVKSGFAVVTKRSAVSAVQSDEVARLKLLHAALCCIGNLSSSGDEAVTYLIRNNLAETLIFVLRSHFLPTAASAQKSGAGNQQEQEQQQQQLAEEQEEESVDPSLFVQLAPADFDPHSIENQLRKECLWQLGNILVCSESITTNSNNDNDNNSRGINEIRAVCQRLDLFNVCISALSPRCFDLKSRHEALCCIACLFPSQSSVVPERFHKVRAVDAIMSVWRSDGGLPGNSETGQIPDLENCTEDDDSGMRVYKEGAKCMNDGRNGNTGSNLKRLFPRVPGDEPRLPTAHKHVWPSGFATGCLWQAQLLVRMMKQEDEEAAPDSTTTTATSRTREALRAHKDLATVMEGMVIRHPHFQRDLRLLARAVAGKDGDNNNNGGSSSWPHDDDGDD